MIDIKHRLIENMALPYITNASPIDPRPRFVEGRNVLTSRKGYSEKRPGSIALLGTTNVTPALMGLRRLFSWQRWDGTFYLFAAFHKVTVAGGKLFKLKVGTDSDWVELTDADDPVAPAEYDFAVANDHLFLANGNKMLKYDGTTVTNWGITGPTSAVATGTSAGALTGAYQYAIAWLNNNTGHTSSPSARASVTAASHDVAISGNTTADPQVTHVRIYRTAAGGSVLFEHPDSPIVYATWVASGYTDSTPDENLTSAFAPIQDQNNRPPAAFGIEFFQGRLWLFNGDKIYYSGFEEIPLGTSDSPEECFPPDNYMAFGRKITGLSTIGDPAEHGMLGVFSASTLFYVAGDARHLFRRGIIAAGIGTRHRRLIAKVKKSVAWFDSAGLIYATDGNSIVELSGDIRPDLTGLDHDRCFIATHSSGADQWLALWTTLTGFSSSGVMLVYDMDTEQWMPPWTDSWGFAAASLETAPGVFRLSYGSGPVFELTRSQYRSGGDPGSAYTSTATLGLIQIVDEPHRAGAVVHVGVEYGQGTTVLALSLLTDEDPSTGSYTALSSITGNPVDPHVRTQGTGLIEKHYKTESGPRARRASVRVSWGNSNANFKHYAIDIAYEDRWE